MTNFRVPDLSESPTRRLLEETRLSQLKPLPKRPACSVCGGFLEADNQFQQSTKICRKCIAHYTKVDAAFNERADEKARAAKMNSFIEKLNF